MAVREEEEKKKNTLNPFASIPHPSSTQSWQGIPGCCTQTCCWGLNIFFFFLKFLFPSTTSSHAQPGSLRHQEIIPTNRSPVLRRENSGKEQLSSPTPSRSLVGEKTETQKGGKADSDPAFLQPVQSEQTAGQKYSFSFSSRPGTGEFPNGAAGERMS